MNHYIKITEMNIIENYEKWLQKRIDNFGNENIINVILLEDKDEGSGTKYDDFTNIYNAIIASSNYASTRVEDSKNCLVCKTPVYNAFLYDITYKIIFDKTPKYDGGFAYNYGYYNPKDDKMHGAFFVFYEKEYDYPKIEGLGFKETVWHELQHAYVQYSVLKRANEQNVITNTKIDNQREIYQNFLDDDKLADLIQDTFYYTNRNEINSHLNEMIPYLKEHEEINFTNYKNYLDEIPGYDIVKRLKIMQAGFETAMVNNYKNKFRYSFGKMVIDKFNSVDFYKFKKLTPVQCTNRTFNRLNNALIYAEHQFYKILSYTLKKLGRKQRFSEMHWHWHKNDNINYDFYKIFNL